MKRKKIDYGEFLMCIDFQTSVSSLCQADMPVTKSSNSESYYQLRTRVWCSQVSLNLNTLTAATYQKMLTENVPGFKKVQAAIRRFNAAQVFARLKADAEKVNEDFELIGSLWAT